MNTLRTTAGVFPHLRLEQTLIRRAIWVLGGSLLLAVSARIQVPMWPVPVTLQDVSVLLLAVALGSRLGALTVAVYLAEGAIGLPVFAQPPYGGLGYLVGPTAGYLAGFILAAFVVGLLAEHGWMRRWPSAFAAMAAGLLVVYLAGFSWMALLMGATPAFVAGIQPFWFAGLIKLVAASGLASHELLPRIESTRMPTS